MTGILHTYIPNSVIDSNGIADGSTLAFYYTGTLTPAPIYTTDALSVEMTNPVVVGAGALVPDLYLDPAITYRRIVTKSDGSVQDTDPWTSIAAAGMSFLQSGTGAIPISMQDKGRLTLDASEFGVSASNSAAVNTPRLQAAFDEAIASKRILNLPTGDIEINATILLPDGAYTLCVKGQGRPYGPSDGINGDPLGHQGTQIVFTGNTGSVIKCVVTGSNLAVYLTFENFTIEGNSAGASGHGIHLQTDQADCAIKAVYRDMTVRNCAEHGIFHDGDVFECFGYDVRCVSNGSSGFKAAANGGGLPGETYFYSGYFNDNDIGIDLGGGGHFALFGISATANHTTQIKANGVKFSAYALQMEGTAGTALASEYLLIQDCSCPVISDVLVTVRASSTGAGIKLENTLFAHITGYSSNSSGAGGGFYDIEIDDNCRACEVVNYYPDGSDLLYLGTLGGHIARRGNQWLSGQAHGQVVYTISTTAQSQAPNARAGDSFIYNVANGVASFTIASPTANSSYHDGQRITITIYNNSGGAPTITWGAGYVVNNVAPVPNGTRRTIQFEWNSNASKWGQVSATLGAIASHIADPSAGGTIDAQSRTAIGLIIDCLEAHGLASP